MRLNHSGSDATMAIPIMRGDGHERSIGVAITIPEPYAQLVRKVRTDAGDPLAQIIPPHVTLLPPTLIDVRAMPSIEQHLEHVSNSVKPFVMRLQGTGTFRPVSDVVFLNVRQGAEECSELARKVNSAMLAQPLRFEYHPHVTLAHDVTPPQLDSAAAALRDYEAQFPVSAITLYEYSSDNVWRMAAQFPLNPVPIGK